MGVRLLLLACLVRVMCVQGFTPHNSICGLQPVAVRAAPLTQTALAHPWHSTQLITLLQVYRALATPGEPEVMLSGAADETYVRSCLIRALEGVSEVAADFGLGAYCYGMEVPRAVGSYAAAGTAAACTKPCPHPYGIVCSPEMLMVRQLTLVCDLLAMAADTEFVDGGSGRSASFTDMLVRKRGTSSYEDASRLVLAVIEVKGSWQLKLDGTMSLQEVLADEELGPSVIKVIQQVSAGASPSLGLTALGLTAGCGLGTQRKL